MVRLIYAPEERRERNRAKAREWRKANRERLRSYMQQWRAAHADELKAYARANSPKYASRRAVATRRYQLKYHYGLSTDEYRDMLVGQAGRCLICGLVPERTMTVDHDHATGKVRGLLCNPCNRLLGIARDSTERLAAAIRYLDTAR